MLKPVSQLIVVVLVTLTVISGCTQKPPTSTSMVSPSVQQNTKFDSRGDPVVPLVARVKPPVPQVAIIADAKSLPEQRVFEDAIARITGWSISNLQTIDCGFVPVRQCSIANAISSRTDLRSSADMLVIIGGSSDVGHLSREVVPSVQQAIVSARKSTSANTPIVLASPIINSGNYSEQQRKTYRDVAGVALRARTVYYVDTYSIDYTDTELRMDSLAQALKNELSTLGVISAR